MLTSNTALRVGVKMVWAHHKLPKSIKQNIFSFSIVNKILRSALAIDSPLSKVLLYFSAETNIRIFVPFDQ